MNTLSQNLAPEVRSVLGLQALARLQAIDKHDFERIVRVTEMKLLGDRKPLELSSSDAELALKQYYALAVVNRHDPSFAVSSIVDPYWHTHILDTRGYRQFCHDAFGQFMDHVPLDKSDPAAMTRIKARYSKTHTELSRLFGKRLVAKAFPAEPTDDIVICNFEGSYE